MNKRVPRWAFINGIVLPLLASACVSDSGRAQPAPPMPRSQEPAIAHCIGVSLGGHDCPASGPYVQDCEGAATSQVSIQRGDAGYSICFQGVGISRCTVGYQDCSGWQKYDFGEYAIH